MWLLSSLMILATKWKPPESTHNADSNITQFHLPGLLSMYAQVGEFLVSWIISTVTLMRFSRNAVFSRNQNARNVGSRCACLYLWNRANLSVFTLSFCHLKERSGWKTAPHTSLSSILLKKVWLHRSCVPCEIFGNPVFCVWLFYSASSPNHPPDFPKGISRVCMHSVLVGYGIPGCGVFKGGIQN